MPCNTLLSHTWISHHNMLDYGVVTSFMIFPSITSSFFSYINVNSKFEFPSLTNINLDPTVCNTPLEISLSEILPMFILPSSLSFILLGWNTFCPIFQVSSTILFSPSNIIHVHTIHPLFLSNSPIWTSFFIMSQFTTSKA